MLKMNNLKVVVEGQGKLRIEGRLQMFVKNENKWMINH